MAETGGKSLSVYIWDLGFDTLTLTQVRRMAGIRAINTTDVGDIKKSHDILKSNSDSRF